MIMRTNPDIAAWRSKPGSEPHGDGADRTAWMRVIAIALVAFVVLVPATGVAQERAKRGNDYAHESGACAFRTSTSRAIVACGLSDRHRVYYWFRIPDDAEDIHVTVHRRSDGCCGDINIRRRWRDVDRDVFVVMVRAYNYGDPIGPFEVRIRRVEVHFARTTSSPRA
jgi:hypothetical protein